jgi:hypothetical protein
MNMVRAVRRLRSLAAVGACFVLSALSGCGGDSTKAALTGKVTYHDAPVTGGTLTLIPATGLPFPITIKYDGTFDIGDAPVGLMKVTINTDNVPASTPGNKMPGGMTPPKDMKMPEVDESKTPRKVVIPANYKSADTSGLTWDTKAERNKTFNLTD